MCLLLTGRTSDSSDSSLNSSLDSFRLTTFLLFLFVSFLLTSFQGFYFVSFDFPLTTLPSIKTRSSVLLLGSILLFQTYLGFSSEDDILGSEEEDSSSIIRFSLPFACQGGRLGSFSDSDWSSLQDSNCFSLQDSSFSLLSSLIWLYSLSFMGDFSSSNISFGH